MTAFDDLPAVRLKPKADQRARRGHPWIYSNEVEMDAPTKALPPGETVRVVSASGEVLDHGWFNPSTLISVRRLETGARAPGADLFLQRLTAAKALRERMIGVPFYRWIHAEADGLPGVIVDRFGDVAVIQANTAGAERGLDALAEAITAAAPEIRAVAARNDTASRALEGLAQETRVLRGEIAGPIRVHENGIDYLCDPIEGQKTGWFYDHRANRAQIGGLCAGAEVLDLYAYAGAFALQAGRGGARSVLSVDRSERSLELAREAARSAGLSDTVTFQRADVFDLLEQAAPNSYDVVIADPPAFAKSRKDQPQAMKGYRKLARLCARLVRPGGYLFVASCSHAVDSLTFQQETARGVLEAGRRGRIVARGGADRDHPEHPHLPESAYLKALTYALV